MSNVVTQLAKILKNKVVLTVGGQKPANGDINMEAYALKSDTDERIDDVEFQILTAAVNLEVISTETSGVWIGHSGETVTSTNSVASDYIVIDSSKRYTLQYWPNADNSNSWIGVTFWDEDKKFLSYKSFGQSIDPIVYRMVSKDFVVPSGAAYVRISYYKRKDDPISHIRFNEGLEVCLPWALNPTDLLNMFYKTIGGTTNV
ncbi:hypothetical protein [Lacticaseibacillus sp. N501-2]|uniref:hypothetical protein n=1 Tax=Lacticaseibacillus salsurae TaxID=3367729 RepID=UPI0038B242F2